MQHGTTVAAPTKMGRIEAFVWLATSAILAILHGQNTQFGRETHMRRCTVFIAAIALTLGTALSAAAEEHGLAGFLGRIAAERPLVKWDAKSAVEGNFDGNHGVTFAALGYKDKQVMVAIGRKATDGSVIAQYLEFGIGAGTQNAI